MKTALNMFLTAAGIYAAQAIYYRFLTVSESFTTDELWKVSVIKIFITFFMFLVVYLLDKKQ